MDLISEDGRLLASATRGAPANGGVLVTDILGDRGLGARSNVRIDFTVESASGRVVPFATFVDDVTGDGVFAAARSVPLSAEDIVIAQASHATGANSDFFATDLHVSNLSAAPANFTVSLLPRVLSGTPRGPRTFTLGPGQTLEAADVLRTAFDLHDPSAAGLRIHPSAAARLSVSSRTYVEKFGGTFGFSIPGLPVSRAIGRDDGFAAVLQLDQSSSPGGFRSNFGVAEVGGADAVVEVEALRGDGGGPAGGRYTYAVAAGSSVQQSLSDLLPSGGRNVFLRVRVVSGEGRILAYGVSIDNTSGDAIFIPAERLEP
jgi:hypothetical protein